jgi:hypothetical protein
MRYVFSTYSRSVHSTPFAEAANVRYLWAVGTLVYQTGYTSGFHLALPSL